MTLTVRSVSLAVLAWGAMSAAAVAQPGSPDPSTVQGGGYTIEPGHTQVLFKLSHMGFSTYYGEFSGVSGMLMLDPRNAARDRVEITIPIASVHTTSERLDGELRSADWFGADQFPTATFRSTQVVQQGPDRATVMGDLTLHGVTRPVTLEARFHGGGANPMSKTYTVGFEVSGMIHRSAFGVSKYVPMVGDDVTLMISGAFEKQP